MTSLSTSVALIALALLVGCEGPTAVVCEVAIEGFALGDEAVFVELEIEGGFIQHNAQDNPARRPLSASPDVSREVGPRFSVNILPAAARDAPMALTARVLDRAGETLVAQRLPARFARGRVQYFSLVLARSCGDLWSTCLAEARICDPVSVRCVAPPEPSSDRVYPDSFDASVDAALDATIDGMGVPDTSIDDTGIDTGIDAGIDTGIGSDAGIDPAFEVSRTCRENPRLAGCVVGGRSSVIRVDPVVPFRFGDFPRNEEGAPVGPRIIALDPYYLDRFEVTVGRFREFWELPDEEVLAERSVTYPSGDVLLAQPARLQSGERPVMAIGDGCEEAWRAPPALATRDRDAQPMSCLPWTLAQAFCIWDGGRLPTEVEWEYAARGRDPGRTWPWGEEDPLLTTGPTCERAWFVGVAGTAPRRVGTCPADPQGFHDLAGNTSELVADFNQSIGVGCWAPETSLENPLCLRLEGSPHDYVIRGGHVWQSVPATNAFREGHEDFVVDDRGEPHTFLSFEGFRCAYDVE